MNEFDTDADSFADAADRAGERLTALADGPASEAAATIEAAFSRAGHAVENALVNAARTGELSFKALAQTIAQTLAELAIDRTFENVAGNTLGSALASLPFFGQRADGGPVVPGGAYLVGERGPELFTPMSAGVVAQPSGGAVTVNIHLPAGANIADVRRSEAQVATMVARAVARGRRNL